MDAHQLLEVVRESVPPWAWAVPVTGWFVCMFYLAWREGEREGRP